MRGKRQAGYAVARKARQFFKKHVRHILGLLLLAAIAYIVVWQVQQRQSSGVIDGAANSIFGNASATPSVTPSQSPSTAPQAPNSESTAVPNREVNPRFIAMRDELGNDEIIGYLKIDDTTVDYPVVQHSDNYYYLNRNLARESDNAGWIFLDYENDVFRADPNTIIYGHNMRSDYMFHSLRNYRDKSFWETHRYFVFDSLYDEQVWEIFCVYVAPTAFYYIQVYFDKTDDFGAMLEQMREYQIYNTGIVVNQKDRILTLSTCTGSNDDERFAVSARLVTDPEVIADVRK